jgi:hypothetical protein
MGAVLFCAFEFPKQKDRSRRQAIGFILIKERKVFVSNYKKKVSKIFGHNPHLLVVKPRGSHMAAQKIKDEPCLKPPLIPFRHDLFLIFQVLWP